MGFCCRSQGTIFSSFLLIFLTSSLPLVSHGADTLTQGQSLKDGQTLVSTGNVFELGFFAAGAADSTNNRYVGIRYHADPARTVVWVANREKPVAAGSSLTIGNDGNLAVLDGAGNVVWSSNLSTASGNSSAQLIDSGNLELRSGDGKTVLWQSFDHPTDTFLPGMKMRLNMRTRENQLFRSWRSAVDPAPGDYSFGLDPSGSAQIFIWKGSVPHWRSGQWNKQSFIGIRVRPLSYYGFNVFTDGDEMYVTFKTFNSSLFRFVMQWDGKEKTSMFVDQTKQWKSVFSKPSTECEIYNKCGNYSICSDTDTDTPICSCLRGFEPRAREDWSRGNWSGGCLRKFPLKCEGNSSTGTVVNVNDDGFIKLGGLKLPDLSDWASTVRDLKGCGDACSRNCSCKAYAFVEGIGCMQWARDLVDTHQFSDGGGYDLYVKLAGSEFGGGKNKTWIVLVIIAVLFVVILILCSYLWWRYSRKIKDCWIKLRKREDLLFDPSNGFEAQPEFTGTNELELADETKDGKCSELPLFSFDCIAEATNNFSESNKLGKGGFGDVYKGILPGGQEIAVKRLSQSSGQGLEEFKNEVILIAKLQHRNLVRLLGCCVQGEEKILLYEYMPNKSLDAFLFNSSRQPLLDWRKRFDIIEGIARGLLYLHRDSRLRIVHRDLKASNVLLDEEMNPKISDFGMARIFGGNQNQANTNRVVGTYGYMSPEYAMEGLFSVKSDVYSFGVLILEVVSGQRSNSFHRSENSPNFIGHAWRLWNEDRALELVDPSMHRSISTRQVMRCIQVGLLCVQDRANDRPTMSSVVFMLGSENSVLPMPKQPTFTLEGSPSETGSSMLGCDAFTSSDVTVTVVVGR